MNYLGSKLNTEKMFKYHLSPSLNFTKKKKFSLNHIIMNDSFSHCSRKYINEEIILSFFINQIKFTQKKFPTKENFLFSTEVMTL